MASFKHNKKRNSGLIYEFLVRRAGSQMLERDKSGLAKTMEITKKYFAEGRVLANELELFKAIRDTRGVSESTARRVLGEVARQSGRLDHKAIDIKKSNLIKELHYGFGKDFFSAHRLPEYRLLATIQLYIDGCRAGRKLTEGVQAIQLEDGLVKYMTSIEQAPQQHDDGEIDDLVCTIAMKKFNERYGKALNRDQKILLETYGKSSMTGNQLPIQRRMAGDRLKVWDVLKRSQDDKDIMADTVMATRLVEAAGKLAKMDTQNVTDEKVEEMLLYWKLAEELTSNG